MLKRIYLQHEPVIVTTPYGDIYIECIETSKELAVTVSNIDSKVTLCLAVSDKDSCECKPCEDLREKIES